VFFNKKNYVFPSVSAILKNISCFLENITKFFGFLLEFSIAFAFLLFLTFLYNFYPLYENLSAL